MCLPNHSSHSHHSEEKKEEPCPWIISVDHMGIQANHPKGCITDTKWLKSFNVPCHHSFFNHLVYIDLPYKKLTCIRNVSHGQFGYIDLARYDTLNGSYEVYVKRPIQDETVTVYEPYIQQFVREGLERFGWKEHVPRVVEVFRLRRGEVCFAMEQVEGGVILDTFLDSYPLFDLSHVFIDILYQVCVMVWLMNHKLGINHRDLKPSNFLLRTEPSSVHYSIVLGEEKVEWNTNHHLSLIDFGFACAGSIETRQSYVSLSDVYSKHDPCPKDGRDIFLFLGYLYSDYYTRMSFMVRSWFESWLAIPKSDICAFLRKDKDISKRWLYYLSGSEDVFQLRSCPLAIIKQLREHPLRTSIVKGELKI